MKHRVFSLSLFLFVLTWVSSPASVLAYSYFVYDEWGGSYSDAEKSPSNSEDDLMCWAAAASNILAWTGWGNVAGESFSDEDVIFQYFQDHWTDQGGSTYYGWDWWFDGINDSQGASGWSQVDVPGGGFWEPTYHFQDYYLWTPNDWVAMQAIECLFDEGYGITLAVTDNSGGHAITCWGYDYDAEGNFLGVYVTDSDDDKGSGNPDDRLAYYDVAYSGGLTGSWYLRDFYGYDTWYITEVHGLEIAHAPEPATLLLVGSGLAGFAGIRRRFRKR